jgi:hypothetical protein
MIAALYVQPGGVYCDLDGVEPWGPPLDARDYAGPHPVVAHPPCSRWCRLAGLVEARWGHKRGDDGGMFAAALASVRRWGGVLEHPAYSHAWPAFGLLRPPASGGWQLGTDGMWVCQVEQGRYGHLARKATWLLAVLPPGVAPPEMGWGRVPDRTPALVSWCRNHSDDPRPRVSKAAASRTPIEFRDALLGIAGMCLPGWEYAG